MLGKNSAALMRGVGQVTLLVLVATGLWHVVALLAGCFGDNPVTSPGGEWIALHTTRTVMPFVALFGFWASLRPERARRAVCGAALVVALELVTPIVWILTAPPDDGVFWSSLLAWALNNLWALVGVGMFAASYRRPTTPARPDEAADDSPTSEAPACAASGRTWIVRVLIPLTAAVWLCAVAAPLSPDIGVLLVAALLYGLLYRTHPGPGGPAATALTLLVLALPNQAYIVATTPGDYGLIAPPLMLAIALGATLASAVAVGAHLYRVYRARRHPAAAGSAVAGDPA